MPLPEAGQGPPRPTLGAIARAHGESFKRQHALTEAQRKVLRAVSTCRTEVLGGRVDVCAKCGDQKVLFNSCRNRHCPACQSLSQARWMAGRIARLLPVDYFHVVFTVPDDLLAGVAMRNRELFFSVLFRAASETLLELGADEKRLGAQLGLTAVLHTWTRDLRFHPHLHCIVTGGGLSRDGNHWRSTKQDYLFPVRVLSALFRGKVMAGLDEAYREGRLVLRGVDGFTDESSNEASWRRLRRKAFRTKWVSYSKPPFAGAESVYRYLGRYTHRVGLSNHRLISATEKAVTFRTRGDQTATLHPHEFLRRFLLHVLPPGFVKMRHYGLLAPGNVNTRLVKARELLASSPSRVGAAAPVANDSQAPSASAWRELLMQLTGIDPRHCEKCGGPIESRPLPRPRPRDSS